MTGRRRGGRVFRSVWLGTIIVVALGVGAASPVFAAKPAPGPSNAWAAGIAVSGVEQPDPTRGSQLNDVAVNASGVALAAWDRFSYAGGGGATIGAAIETGGRWSAPIRVSGATGFSSGPRVAVADDGALAVSWTYQDPVASPAAMQRIQVAVRPAGSSTWATTTLASNPIGGVQGLALFVPLAFDAAGNLTAAWTLWNGVNHEVQVATLPKGGTWSTPTSIEPGFDGLYPALAVDRTTGRAGLAYVTSAYASGAGTVARFASRGGPAAAWTAPVTVSETLPNTAGYITNPVVGVDGRGLATVAWLGRGVEAARQLGPDSWTSPATVIPAPNATVSFSSPDLGVDRNGSAILAVSIFDATINVDRASAWAARGASSGSWTAPVRLTDPAAPVDAYAVRATIAPDGGLVLVAWVDHYHGTVQAARLDLTAGTWTTTTVGKGTAWSSFQEVVGLDAAASTTARIAWKNAKTGTQTFVADFRG